MLAYSKLSVQLPPHVDALQVEHITEHLDANYVSRTEDLWSITVCLNHRLRKQTLPRHTDGRTCSLLISFQGNKPDV